MPVDRDPVLGGKIDLAKSSGNGIPTAYGLNDGERFNAVLDGKDLYRSHHESCPEIIANSRGRRKQGRRRKR